MSNIENARQHVNAAIMESPDPKALHSIVRMIQRTTGFANPDESYADAAKRTQGIYPSYAGFMTIAAKRHAELIDTKQAQIA